MKWSGQHIYDLVSRFRDDVYISGNVGIGTNSPEGQLEIASSNANRPLVYITNTSTTADDEGGNLIFRTSDPDANLTDNDVLGDISFFGQDNSDDAYINSAYIRGRIDGTPGTNDMPGELAFYTNTGENSATQKMTIRANGNVGIGTTAPDSLLHLNHDTNLGESVGDLQEFITLSGDTANADSLTTGLIRTSTYSDANDWLSSQWRIQRKIDSTWSSWINFGGEEGSNYHAHGLSFGVGGSTADALGVDEAMRIEAGGNVGIGTTSPDTKLEVNGSFAANGPSSTFVTMDSGDTSPDVSGGNIFKTHADAGVTIDQFDGGRCGQTITIISGNAVVYDVTSSELKGGTTNITTATGDVTMWVCESATIWHLISWMDLSADLSSGGF